MSRNDRYKGLQASESLKFLVVILLAMFTCEVQANIARANDAPVICELATGCLFEDYWWFSGYVDDENPEYCLILFGEDMDGFSCSVNSDGTFFAIFEMSPANFGLVSAITQDDHGVWSQQEFLWNGN